MKVCENLQYTNISSQRVFKLQKKSSIPPLFLGFTIVFPSILQPWHFEYHVPKFNVIGPLLTTAFQYQSLIGHCILKATVSLISKSIMLQRIVLSSFTVTSRPTVSKFPGSFLLVCLGYDFDVGCFDRYFTQYNNNLYLPRRSRSGRNNIKHT